jgi:D-aspartate ligase
MPSPPAYVLGDVDLVSALGRAGIPSVVVTQPDDPARHSRHAVGWLPWVDHWRRPELLVERLVRSAQGLPERPVLCYQSDGDLLVVSRFRDELARAFRFVIAGPELVEDLVDKGRFARLADRLNLGVPRTVLLDPGAEGDEQLRELRLPVVVKPTTRRGLVQLGEAAKATRVDDLDELHRRVALARRQEVPVVVQELVEGAETRMESYHAYVDTEGEVVASFTGAKLRTRPRQFGHSTVLTTTHQPDVLERGEQVVRRLGLTGLVKVDLKRDPQGRLWLLEVNPRYTLWHHVGAAAGLNLAALAHADLTGRPRTGGRTARPGVTWCDPVRDLRGVATGELTPAAWLRSTWSCSVRSGAAPHDLGPLLRGRLLPGLRRAPRTLRRTAA